MRRYFANVYGFFHARIPEHAEDLAQRTFLACAEQREAYRGAGTFRAYVFGIARKQMLKHFEKSDIVRRAAFRELPPTGLPSPTGLVANREQEQLLLRALVRLPVDTQVLLQLHYWERLSTEEIATVMQLGRSAVKVRLHRARERLRDEIDADEASPSLNTITQQSFDGWARSLRDDD